MTDAEVAQAAAVSAAASANTAATAEGNAVSQAETAYAHRLAAENARDDLLSQKGAADGLGTLDGDGKQPESEVPERLSEANLTASVAAQLLAGGISFAYLAANPELLTFGTITRDADSTALSADVTWPDGATGTYAGTPSASMAGAVDSYSITHDDGTTVTTYTQPTMTRDANGAVVNRPEIVVS